MPDRSPCRSCGAPLLWVRYAASGSLAPLDAEPVADGNIAVVNGLAYVAGSSLFEPEGPMLPPERYKSHHATCPQAAAWRRSKEKP